MLNRLELWLHAVRDGFISLLPLTFFRVFIQLVQNFPWDSYHDWMNSLFGSTWNANLSVVVSISYNVFSIALTVLIAIHLSAALSGRGKHKREELPAFIIVMGALVNFAVLVYAYPLSFNSFGFQSIFLAILVGILSTELLRWVYEHPALNIVRIPYDTEESFYYASQATVPLIIVSIVTFAVSQALVHLIPSGTDLSKPMVEWAQASGHGIWWLSAAASLINHVFWYLGFHGSMLLYGSFSSLFTPIGLPYSPENAWKPIFDSFVFMGGSGATMGLLLAIAISTKRGTQRQVAKISFLPSIFNINDVLLYGLPIVLNPLYLVPFIIVPLVLCLLTVGAAQFGFVEFHTAHTTWVTPPFLSGWLLTGSWRGVFLQAVCLTISTLIYMPFVRRAEASRLNEQLESFSKVKKFILDEERVHVSALHMQDEIGIISRGLLSDFREAIKHNKLHLAYQPKHDIHGHIIGVEALIRWESIRYGEVPAYVGITLAEDSGDIHQLGEWVIEEACACKARWNRLGYHALTMAVNVSPIQLSNPELPNILQQSLARHKLSPNELELEITESAVIPDTQAVVHTLKILTDFGVRLSMDDFGMGYSSLLYLRRINIHTIKIDGSLTRDVLNNSTNIDIIRTIGALGRMRKVHVVAEFVESEEQLEMLKGLGCNVFQGYLYSPALDERDCIDYFELHSSNLSSKQGA